MHIHKTGALIRAAVAAGRALRRTPARRARGEPRPLRQDCVGLAFQVVDDVLDAEAEHRDAGQDRRQGRAPGQADLRVSCWALARARELAAGAAARGARSACAASARARGACASSPTSSCCASSSHGDPDRSAPRRRLQSGDVRAAEDHQRPGRPARARPAAAAAARRGAARVPARLGGEDRRPSVVQPRHGRADASRCTTCSTRPTTASSGTSATRPTRTRSSPGGARRWRGCACSDGISGFPRRSESRTTTPSARRTPVTSISAALGMAVAARAEGRGAPRASRSSATAR